MLKTYELCKLTQIVDALACLAEEGRYSPRKSSGNRLAVVIRWCPNRETSLVEILVTAHLCVRG